MSPPPSRDLPQATLSNKNFPNRILRNCRASAFILFIWEWQGLSTQLIKWQKGAIPASALGLAHQSPAEMRVLLWTLHCCKMDPEGSLPCSFPMPLMEMEELASARDFPEMEKPQILSSALLEKTTFLNHWRNTE